MSELLIRPGPNDHKVIQDLLAPGGASVFLPRARPLVDRLVLDAHVARARPEFAEAASSVGLPVLVDPSTPFWQGELREKDRWAQLPFGRAEKLNASDLANPFVREALVAQVVDFQIEQGATAIIPPYLYVVSPADRLFELALEFLRATGRYMARERLALPLIPVLCGQLKGFGSERTWRAGIDRFVSVAVDLGPEAVGVCLSPAGTGSDSYSKVLRLFASSRRIKLSGAKVIAWRQGIYGPGLVAAGLDGYETGVGTRELCNISSSIASRKPPKPGKKAGGGGLPGIYLEPFHRSVSSRVGETLLGHRSMRPKVMCDDERCCPMGRPAHWTSGDSTRSVHVLGS